MSCEVFSPFRPTPRQLCIYLHATRCEPEWDKYTDNLIRGKENQFFFKHKTNANAETAAENFSLHLLCHWLKGRGSEGRSRAAGVTAVLFMKWTAFVKSSSS